MQIDKGTNAYEGDDTDEEFRDPEMQLLKTILQRISSTKDTHVTEGRASRRHLSPFHSTVVREIV